MASAISVSVVSSTFESSFCFSSSSHLLPSLSVLCSSSSSSLTGISASSSHRHRTCSNRGIKSKHSIIYPVLNNKAHPPYPYLFQFYSSFTKQICRAAEYKFPDPIPEFAEAETEKFRTHLVKKLSKKKDMYEDSIEEVVGICTEIFSTFLHTEYGGPGTLLVIPFIDMADTLNERGLPGGPQAARAAVKWAEAHVDKDWKEWTNGGSHQ